MTRENISININQIVVQQSPTSISAPIAKEAARPESTEKKKLSKGVARKKCRNEQKNKMKSTLFRSYIKRLLKTDQAKKDFLEEWAKEKAYNKTHNLKMFMRIEC